MNVDCSSLAREGIPGGMVGSLVACAEVPPAASCIAMEPPSTPLAPAPRPEREGERERGETNSEKVRGSLVTDFS